MKLIPLKQWICDSCGGIIEKPEDGWLEWYSKESVESNFRIVHHNRSCMYDDLRKHNILVSDLNLTDVIGTHGLANSLFRIELSEKGVDKIQDLKEFVEILRRLHVPYWEEARLYWDRALKEGFHDGCDFGENTLRSIIEEFEQSQQDH
ncbi:hypothetical protein ACFLVE_01490 [Chloroflexota bacterium]